MSDLFLVRHCEPRVTGVMLGASDPGLSKAGRAQAATLLPGVKFSAVYASPLRRALETARILARGAPLEIISDLRDISFGIWDGRTWSDIEAANPELAARKILDWHGVTPPGGEPWTQFAERVIAAFERLRTGPRPAAVVAHAAVLHVIAQIDRPYGGIYEL